MKKIMILILGFFIFSCTKDAPSIKETQKPIEDRLFGLYHSTGSTRDTLILTKISNTQIKVYESDIEFIQNAEKRVRYNYTMEYNSNKTSSGQVAYNVGNIGLLISSEEDQNYKCDCAWIYKNTIDPFDGAFNRYYKAK
jgi:hypothetical protein